MHTHTHTCTHLQFYAYTLLNIEYTIYKKFSFEIYPTLEYTDDEIDKTYVLETFYSLNSFIELTYVILSLNHCITPIYIDSLRMCLFIFNWHL